MSAGLEHPSGRVIALGRLMLATLFLLSILVDVSQPARAPVATYAVLAAYIAFAAAMVVATWRNWWLDARLAGPAHGIDIALFALLVLLTEGYTAPFFTFFIFLLLSAAIRWGWHMTALTAILLTLLYLVAGLLVVTSGAHFELQRFVVRTGHLVTVSLILIWFGANQGRARFYLRDVNLLEHPSPDESPLETGLRAAMYGVHASAGVFVWRDHGRSDFTGLGIRDGELVVVDVPAKAIEQALASTPFLYDLRRNRALKKDFEHNLTYFPMLETIAPKTASRLELNEGLAIPVRSHGGEGELFLEGITNLSTDHIDIGEQIAADVAAHLQRHATIRAAEENAAARSRVTLARDLHDSAVQFLAGAAFRLEAIKRSHASSRDFEPELEELKHLMLQEQRELRFFIEALRSGPLVAFNDLAKDLDALAGRLSRQWQVACVLVARPAEIMIPIALHLDALQLMREAVANAVRHAEAHAIQIELAVVADELRLEFVNENDLVPKRGQALDMPLSLKDRVEAAGGAIEMVRGTGLTKVSIWLPIGAKPR